MQWTKRNALLLMLVAVGLTGIDWTTHARSFRVNMMPNGNVNDCSNCHVGPFGGGRRTPFGEAVRSIVGGGTNRPFWDAALAALDSDGDGFTNGEELGDPDGDGVPTPGAQVTNPGVASDFPEIVEPEPEPVSTTLHIAADGKNLTLTWEEGGVLESASSPQGPWEAVDGANSPHQVVADGAMSFYRVGDGSGGQTFTLRLSAAPGVTSGGSGSGTISIDGNQLSIHVRYSGLTGDFTAAHLHGPADVGGSAGVLFAVDGEELHQAEGSHAGAFIGSGEVSDDTIEALLGGKAYLNVHSSASPGGEIRAHILP